jgi:two-component system osmolarity sensor histidine kinase EnvZ
LVAERTAQTCRIGVLDRGPGIAAEQLEAVFQPFFRLDASRSPITGGSGLGLAIVRELARANGWQVTLLAREGGGLQAWIALPQTGT